MIDFDIYIPNPAVEKFLEQFKARLKKNCPTTKVYISTASHNDYWLQKLYSIYNNTKLME